MRSITRGLVAGSDLFLMCSPGPGKCIKAASKIGVMIKVFDCASSVKNILEIDSIDDTAKAAACGVVGSQVHKRVRGVMKTSLKHAGGPVI